MMKLTVAIILLAGCMGSAFAEKMPPELKTLKAGRTIRFREIDTAYVQALEKLEIKYTKRGDLASANAVHAELSKYKTADLTDPSEERDGPNLIPRLRTDPLLVIETTPRFARLLDPGNGIFKTMKPGENVEIQHDRTPLSYNEAWGKKDVFQVLPFREKPGVVDFSKITAQGTGLLELEVRNHVKGGPRIKILVNGEPVDEAVIEDEQWVPFTVQFDRAPVILEVHASGRGYDYCFITYRIKK